MIDDVCATRVYEREGNDTKVAVSVGYSFVRLTTCLHHVLALEHGQLSWTLDASQPTSFASNEGFWLVREDPSDPNCSVIYYSIALELKLAVPGWVNGFVEGQGIPRAVAWVKRAAEKRWRSNASQSPLHHYGYTKPKTAEPVPTKIATGSAGGSLCASLAACLPLAMHSVSE